MGYASYQQCSGPSCGWSQLGLGQRIGAETACRVRIGPLRRSFWRSCLAPFSVSRGQHCDARKGRLGLIFVRKNADPAGGGGDSSNR